MHSHEITLYCACSSLAIERHAHEMHAYEMHAYERHAHERHAYKRHAYGGHAHERHAREMLEPERVLCPFYLQSSPIEGS